MTHVPNPYDVLPPPERGDKSSATIFRNIGQALTLWELIEEHLADIFSIMLGGGTGFHVSPAQRSYGAIVTYKARAEMLSAASQVYFKMFPHADFPGELKALLVEVGRFSARRNEIAHGSVKQWSVSSKDFEIEQDRTWYLMPAVYNTSKTEIFETNRQLTPKAGQTPQEALYELMLKVQREGYGKYKYNAKQIRHYGKHFERLSGVAGDLKRRMLTYRDEELARRALHDKQPPQPPPHTRTSL
jgi:hypothetical protein